MQIKVTNTRIHKEQFLYQMSSGVYFKDTPVAEAKLVLMVTDQLPKKGELYKETAEPDYYSCGFVLKDAEAPSSLRLLKPILISETEKIEVGDWAYNKDTKAIVKLGNPEKGEIAAINHQGNWFKILALPEHFSPKHLQAIVDGKMKDGEKVLVECYNSCPCQLDRCEEPIMAIKFNSQSHITLHPVEKMYGEEDMKASFRAGRLGATNATYYSNFEQWLAAYN